MVPNTPAHATYLREIKTAGQRTGIAVLGLEVRGRDEIERAFTALTKAHAQGLVVLPNPVTLTHQTQIVELAAKNRLPAMYPWPEFTESGGLMAYSTNRTELYGRSAAFVARILRGREASRSSDRAAHQVRARDQSQAAKALGLTLITLCFCSGRIG